MNISQAIEFYVGRKVDFLNEVCLIQDHEGNITIEKWDLPIPLPTMSELEVIYNNQINNYERNLKLIKLRNVRDYLLQQSDWITSRRSKETEAINLGLMTEQDRKWTNTEYSNYLYWTKTMNDLPSTIANEDLDNLNIDNIVPSNTMLFPVCPLDTRLTALSTD